MMRTAPPCAFVIFGITGDLASRKLLPALYRLHCNGGLDEGSEIVGYARSGLDDESLREQLRESLTERDDFDPDAWNALAPRIHYVRGGYGDQGDMTDLRKRLDALGTRNRVLYTATPPETYEAIADALGAAGLADARDGFVRVVVEKPFGRDAASARALNEKLLASFREEQIFRIDHYLAKETAQNLAVLRFANTIFEPLWTNRFIDHVQITMAETMGIEGRGSFYESAGVVRDVFQNHLLQLLALVAMEPPARYEADAVRDEKVKVFRAVECVRPEQAVLGQYVAADGMKGYREENDVASDSSQATYAAVELAIRNWRWSGVPFFVRSGKRLRAKATEIVLHFKTPPHVPFDLRGPLRADRLVLRVSPDEGIDVRFNAKSPGQRITLDRVSLAFTYGTHFERPNPDAYETLVHDAMIGDATLFMRADEVEAQWKIVEPLLELDGRAPLPYAAGSMGPAEADALLQRRGRHWHRPAAAEGQQPD